MMIALVAAASLNLHAAVAAVAALRGEPHVVSAAAITSDAREVLTLENEDPLAPSARRRVVLVAAIGGGDEAGQAVVETVRWFKTSAPAALRRDWAMSAAPDTPPDQAARLARWAAFQAPDLIVELGPGGMATWSTEVLKPATAGLGDVPVAALAIDRDVTVAVAELLRKTAAERSPLHLALLARAARDPLAMARVLATHYPQQPIMSYIPSVAWVSMLRLAGITHEREWRDKVVDQTRGWIAGEKPLFGTQTPLTSVSGSMIFGEMKDVGNANALLAQAARLAEAVKDDGTYANGRGWTDDMFMATAVLVRSGRLDLAGRMLLQYAGRLQRPDGIFIHGVDGPIAWGRGNGFAAFGAMEALSAMPASDPLRPKDLGHVSAPDGGAENDAVARRHVARGDRRTRKLSRADGDGDDLQRDGSRHSSGLAR